MSSETTERISNLKQQEAAAWKHARRKLKKPYFFNIAFTRLQLVDTMIDQTNPDNVPELALLTNERHILEEATQPTANNHDALLNWFQSQEVKNQQYAAHWKEATKQLETPSESSDHFLIQLKNHQYYTQRTRDYQDRLQTCRRFLKNFS